MTISTSCLVHFTKQIDFLIEILKNGFKVSLCEEKLNFVDKLTPSLFYVPMVSFCDIPLSSVQEHTHHYGEYGIGLTKDWGIKKGISPVNYIVKKQNNHPNALSVSLNNIAAHLSQMITFTEGKDSSYVEMMRYLSYTKTYCNDTKNSRYDEGYIYYNEREWRYVPEQHEGRSVLPWYYEKDDFERLGLAMYLGFDPKDIRYIIVKSESDISHIIETITAAKGKLGYPKDMLNILNSRIITYDQIINDF